jgi:methylated-DNA-[protein]-cysteine S-methyltransferase
MKFQDKVLALTKRVPKGKVTTYKEIAKALKTKAYRAVGMALKNNKKPIIIPCQRVVSSDGSLGGYKGKLNNKEKIRLLRKEGIKIKENKIIDFEKRLFRF